MLYVNQNTNRKNRIRELAYYKWLEAGKPNGDGLNFWTQAEAEYEAAERIINSQPTSIEYPTFDSVAF